MNALQEKLENLKNKFMEYDVFGDNDEELRPLYFNMIDSIKTTTDLKKLKEQFLADDLMYSDSKEIEQTQIFNIIDSLAKDVSGI